MNLTKALEHVERLGACLVFPQDNRPEPMSLWRAFFPRSAMRWDWDDGGDPRVHKLWHLREELGRSTQVVYSKWYKGRATLLSRDVFGLLLAAQSTAAEEGRFQLASARKLYEILEDNSPLSTKELKKASDLGGKLWAGEFDRAMKELWLRGLVVGCGERDDGAFPSLLVGATKLIFEDLWSHSKEVKPSSARLELEKRLGPQNPFFKQLLKKNLAV